MYQSYRWYNWRIGICNPERRCVSRAAFFGIFRKAWPASARLRCQRVVVVTAHLAARDRLHHDAIAARYDIHIAIVESVVKLGLRDQVRKLAPHGHHGLVAPQRTSPIAGAVDDDFLGKPAQLLRVMELTLLDSPAGNTELGHQHLRVARYVEHENASPPDAGGAKRRVDRAQVFGVREQILQPAAVCRER